MKYKPVINIYGVDSFFKYGVESVLADIPLRMPLEPGQKIPQIDIWIISQKCLTNVLPFVNRSAPKRPCIVFCSDRCQRLLQDPPIDWTVCLLDLDIPVAKLEQELSKKLSTLLLMGRFDENTTPQLYLSEIERETVRHLSMGYSPHRVAQLTHKSVKTISTHKRNSMKRLGVFSNQELMMKVKILGLH
ncbi:LuxR C-terminal-related transcriptional regulator [Serratia fonticola]|jgi:two-component system capsular synthesis response regulator RcsB|uniref:helix-turn-helix transcriptional regulator n=1 Tax=Serratia fonticola TaxID=47917 RepID=UPI003AAF4CC7